MAAHSRYGFSGQAMIFACPGSVDMQEGLPEPDDTTAADNGTAVHELAEFSLNYGVDCAEMVGEVFYGKRITKPMAEAGQVYVDYVRAIMRQRPGAEMLIEQRVKMSSIDQDRLWGTSDCVIIDRAARVLIIGDYKNGYGLVEVAPEQYCYATRETLTGNVQLIGYALSALDTFDLWTQIDHVVMFIGQPNKDHCDGVIRHTTLTIDEMCEWWKVYWQSHALSISGNAPLNAGSHCKHCRARGHCGVRIRKMLTDLSFDESIYLCDPDKLIALLPDLPAIKSTCDAIVDAVTRHARQGVKVPGYKLVREIKWAECTDPDEFVSAALESGASEDDLYNKRLKGKTALKTFVDKDLVDKYFVTPQRGLQMVQVSDSRPAVMADEKPSAVGKFGAIK